MSATETTPPVTWNGLTWEKMPGQDSEMKKMNFALFRRGVLSAEDYEISDVSGQLKRKQKVNPFGTSKRAKLEHYRRLEEARELAVPLGRPRSRAVVPPDPEPEPLPDELPDHPLLESFPPEPVPVPVPEEPAPTTMKPNPDAEISGQQRELMARYEALTPDQRKLFKPQVASSTLYLFKKGHQTGEKALGKIQEGLDAVIGRGSSFVSASVMDPDIVAETRARLARSHEPVQATDQNLSVPAGMSPFELLMHLSAELKQAQARVEDLRRQLREAALLV